jgi:hypothetical protein
MAMPSELTPPLPDPDEKLVKVFDTEQESEAMVVKGLLESGGIEANLTSISTVQDAFPGLGGVILMVREEDADVAKKIIAEFQRSPESTEEEASGDEASDEDETCEINLTTVEPPAKA